MSNFKVKQRVTDYDLDRLVERIPGLERSNNDEMMLENRIIYDYEDGDINYLMNSEKKNSLLSGYMLEEALDEGITEISVESMYEVLLEHLRLTAIVKCDELLPQIQEHVQQAYICIDDENVAILDPTNDGVTRTIVSARRHNEYTLLTNASQYDNVWDDDYEPIVKKPKPEGQNMKINSKYRNIAISGQISAGKSTLVEKLGNLYNVTAHKETIDEEILSLFTDVNINKVSTSVKNPELLNQFHFLAETITRDIKAQYFNETTHIFDRSIIEHIYIFAKQNLSYKDYALYHGLQELILSQLGWNKYDLNILLVDTNESIYNKIQQRARKQEELTPEYKEYLDSLNEVYNSDEFHEVLGDYAEEVIVVNVNGKSADDVFNEVMNLLK